MISVHVDASTAYDALIGPGLSARAGELLSEIFSPCTAAIVTDTTVNALYGDAVEESLRSAGFETLRYAFPAGEAHKTLETLGDILEYLAERHLTRSDLIVALGGGVPGDVAGFAAAVYARGIPFVQIPTTLLACVDSSVGGKTAVDLKAGKNLAGCFHQPSRVIADTDIIRALPGKILSDGAAEVIKYGVLQDPELLGWMEDGSWQRRLDEVIARSLEIKQAYVRDDEFDRGRRRLLNLGHTFGHAIEKRSGFSITHGQAVAMGMAIAAGAAGAKALCGRIIAACASCGLPVRAPYPSDELAREALSDKKREGETITLVLPEEAGRCALVPIPVGELADVFRRGMAAVEALS